MKENQKTALTWTITLLKDWKIYLENWLEFINRKTSIKRSKFPREIKKKTKKIATSSRDNLLKFFTEDLGFFEINNPEQSKKYNIFIMTNRGYRFINFNQEKKEHYLHGLLMDNIFHYKFAFDYLIRNQLYDIEFKKLFELLIQASLNLLGFPVYDRHSFSNIKNIFKALNSIYEIYEDNKGFKLNDNYRVEFDQQKFSEKVKEVMNENDISYTYDLCNFLNKESQKKNFIKSNYESYNEKIIFEKLKDLTFVKFKGGLARRFIPASFTLIELK